MSVTKLKEAVRRAVADRELAPLFDHFADDVEIAVTLDVVDTAQRVCKGRGEALAYLRASHDVMVVRSEAHEVFGTDDRIIAVLDHGLSVRPGLALRAECVLVLDVRDRKIGRLAIHHELKPVLQARGPAALDAAAAQSPPWSDAA